MTARNEQETTVSAGRDDEWVFVWTNNPVHARRLDADARAVLVTPGDDFGGQYKIRASDFDPRKGFRRKSKPMTDDQRAAAAARLAEARKATA